MGLWSTDGYLPLSYSFQVQGQYLLSESLDHWGFYSAVYSLERCIATTKIQNSFVANDTWLRTAKIYGLKLPPHILDSVLPFSELEERLLQIDSLKSSNNNPCNIFCILQGVCAASELPVTHINPTCPWCWQGDSV